MLARRSALPLLRAARPARYTDAAPFKLIEVPTEQLRYLQHRWRGEIDLPWLDSGPFARWASHRRRWHAGRVLDGDWDEMREDLDTYHLTGVIHERFALGRAWEEISYVRRAVKKASRGERAWGSRCATADEVWARCRNLDSLYRRLLTEGYRRSSGGDPGFTHMLVNIGRDGEIIRNHEGKHRILLSRLIGIEHLPARVLIRHRDWQAIRGAIRHDGDEDLIARHGDHPDLEDIVPSRRGRERAP